VTLLKNLLLTLSFAVMLSSCSVAHVRAELHDPGPVPMLTFIFDDGNETDYSVAREVFKRNGVTASIAVVTDWINTPGYLAVNQLLELQSEGFEIMSHTVSHPVLSSLSRDKIETELSASRRTLANWGLIANNLVYPYNKNNLLVREVAAMHYRSSRAGGSMLNSGSPDLHELKSYRFSHDMKKMKALVDSAYSAGKWLMLYLHNLDLRARVSDGTGSFIKGEEVFFRPSGAAGIYSSKLFSEFYFIPVSGVPASGDTVTGAKNGASWQIDEVEYNDREDIAELIKYTLTRYPDMKIVTLDRGLDIYGVIRPDMYSGGSDR